MGKRTHLLTREDLEETPIVLALGHEIEDDREDLPSGDVFDGIPGRVERGGGLERVRCDVCGGKGGGKRDWRNVSLDLKGGIKRELSLGGMTPIEDVVVGGGDGRGGYANGGDC